jgi:sulfite reductase (NADPH) flavoprotein alpha-component
MEANARQVLTRYDKDNPLLSEVLINYKLNKDGSQKDTRHIVISLENSNMGYEPGDALYTYAKNDPALVQEILKLIKLDLSDHEEFLRFSEQVNITRPSNKLFAWIENKLSGKAGDAKVLAERFQGYSCAALLQTLRDEYPNLEISANELAENSSKLLPRAYSIASSLKTHPNEVHLCISRVEELINGQRILGVCSNYLLNRAPVKSKEVKIYVHHNDKFRLPEDLQKDIIMVGPGTGIAPFRAFIEERNLLRKAGKKVGVDWLFFGDQRSSLDFLYEDELKKYQKDFGLKLTTAFSRDQENKIYVQHRMKEHSADIYNMLKNGAYFYVCGDAKRMAKDVDNALREIASEHGEDAEKFINQLKESKRYCRDVY